MPRFIECGSGTAASNPADDLISVSVNPGDTVTVKVSAGSTITHYQKGHSGGSTGTTTNGSTLTLTTPGTHYISTAANGRSSLQISGGIYGG